MLARRDTQSEASRVRRLSPLQTVEDQSQAWGLCCHSCTWREGLAPSWKLSYTAFGCTVLPRPSVLFRPTDRTSTNAVLMCQPHTVRTCLTRSIVPNTTRCLTATMRLRRYDFTTCA